MNKSIKAYIILLAIVIGILTFLQLNKSTIIDWRKTFDPNSKSPFGLYIFNQEIEELLGDKVARITDSPYEYYTKDSMREPSNILLVNQYLTQESIKKVLERVAKGDHVMYITNDANYLWSDTLKFEYNYSYNEYDILELLNESYKADSIYIDKVPGRLNIFSVDTTNAKVLGSRLSFDYASDKEEKRANFIEIKHGKGKVYIHTEPLFLTNFYLLNKDDYRYAEDVFSYLPRQKTLFFVDLDEYVSESPLRFILQTPALRHAWYTMLIGLILFIIFNAKRRQRVVPIIEPNRNMSAEFVKTIGNLYLQEGNYKDMAHKKATYFLNKIRTDLLLDTHQLDEVFWRKIALKTGAEEKDIQEVKPLVEKAIHPQAPVQESELIRLNELLNKIYN
ncbi:DUF4350 domain-containing protein [Flavobacteriaceae bacterium Ap0902]|nr:DUF4350 domain-containing protein [Flavobacteriaceae bacterium Ap0902]